MAYLVYYPLDRKLKKKIEEDFKKYDKKIYYKLLNELNKIKEIGANYIHDKMKQETHLPHSKKSIDRIEPNLYELRIPKRRKGGVFRVYLTIFPDSRRVMMLDAEYKTQTQPERLEEAKKRSKKLKEEAEWRGSGNEKLERNSAKRRTGSLRDKAKDRRGRISSFPDGHHRPGCKAESR